MTSGSSFEVVYLGSAMLSQQSATGLGAIQKPLLELYTHYRTSGTSRIQRKFLEVTSEGYTLSYHDGPSGPVINESYPVSAMQYAESVRLTIIKGSSKKLKSAFEPLDPETNMNVSKLYANLDKKKQFLAKIVHPSIFVCVLRRVVGPRALDCHAFVCSSTDTAIKLSRSINYLIRQHLNDDDDNESTVFKYKPYEQQRPSQQPMTRELPPDKVDKTRKASSLFDQEFFTEPMNDSISVERGQGNLQSANIWRPVGGKIGADHAQRPASANIDRSRSKSIDTGLDHFDPRIHRRAQSVFGGESVWPGNDGDSPRQRDGENYHNRRKSSPLDFQSPAQAQNRPVAKVPPHKIQGIKVLPTLADLPTKNSRRHSVSDDDDDQRVFRYDRQEVHSNQESRSQRSHSNYEGNWGYATKMPDFSPQVEKDNSQSFDDSQQRGVKEAEIASALKNFRMDHEVNKQHGNDFESSLGYLP